MSAFDLCLGNFNPLPPLDMDENNFPCMFTTLLMLNSASAKSDLLISDFCGIAAFFFVYVLDFHNFHSAGRDTSPSCWIFIVYGFVCLWKSGFFYLPFPSSFNDYSGANCKAINHVCMQNISARSNHPAGKAGRARELWGEGSLFLHSFAILSLLHTNRIYHFAVALSRACQHWLAARNCWPAEWKFRCGMRSVGKY